MALQRSALTRSASAHVQVSTARPPKRAASRLQVNPEELLVLPTPERADTLIVPAIRQRTAAIMRGYNHTRPFEYRRVQNRTNTVRVKPGAQLLRQPMKR